MTLPRAGGKNHRIRRIYSDVYELSWSYEFKYSGSNTLWHRRMHRDTDRAGALRFAKKWGCPMPPEPGE